MLLKRLPIKRFNKFERGYLSASIDTDGSVFIIKLKSKTNNYHAYQGHVSFYNTSIKWIECIRDIIGGGSYHKLTFVEGRKQAYRYDIPRLAYNWVLPQLSLIIKQEKLELVMKLQKIVTKRRGRGRGKSDSNNRRYMMRTDRKLEKIYKEFKLLTNQ